MNLGQLIDTAKELAADRRASGLWSFDALKVYANEAEVEAAHRSRLIFDLTSDTDGLTTPANLCLYPVLKGAYSIVLHPKIIFVRRVKVISHDLPLPKIHLRDLDRVAAGWEAHAEGSVVAYCANWQKGRLLFYNAFDANDSVRLQVIRAPLEPMIGPADSPEIDEQHHMGLISWMLYRAFSKPDPDTKDKARSQEYLDAFERQFGKRSSAIDEAWIQNEHGYDLDEGLF